MSRNVVSSKFVTNTQGQQPSTRSAVCIQDAPLDGNGRAQGLG